MTSITEQAPLNVKEIQSLAKELKVTGWNKMKREELVKAIAVVKGWGDEKPEVIEFLLSGGCITEVPGFTGIKPRPNNRETSAGGKVEPSEPTKKTPRKLSKGAKEPRKVKESTGDTITIQEICEELGVEGRVARRKLRGSDIAKPGDSWTWAAGHEDIQKVKDLLKK